MVTYTCKKETLTIGKIGYGYLYLKEINHR